MIRLSTPLPNKELLMCRTSHSEVFHRCNPMFGVAARLDTTPMTVALAWLLQRSPNILLIPGTSLLSI